MGIKSTENWSGIQVNGVTLGEPHVHEDGTFEWDGGVPEGTLDNNLMFTPEGEAAPVSLQEMSTVTISEWKQPEGAHDAHPKGTIVEVDGVFWVSLIDANVWAPGVSGWRRISSDSAQVFPWVQPTGAHDAYGVGDRVLFNSQVFESVIPANVWSPAAYPAGWKVV